VKYDLFMDVSSLEHVVIRAKLGDIIAFQIIQIAVQKASFQLTIIALAIKIVPTYRDLNTYTSGLGTCTVGILLKMELSLNRVVETSRCYLHCLYRYRKPAEGW
jgi:hypothetical protein